MAARSAIEWCDATWQVASGCNPISGGCRHCYSARLAGTRLRHLPRTEGLTTRTADGRYVFNGTVRFHADQLDWMLRWRAPKNLGRRPRVFVADRSDLFHDAISDAEIDQVFAVMALRPDVDFLLLTKRAKRMREYFEGRKANFGRCSDQLMSISHCFSERHHEDACDRLDLSDLDEEDEQPLPNVWLGVSVEDQRTADERIPELLAAPAAVRFVSVEPLLGRINLNSLIVCNPREMVSATHGYRCVPDRLGEEWIHAGKAPRLDWVIVGGESGPGARPMHPDWARSLRDQCAAADVSFLFKQWGEWLPWEPEQGPCWISQNYRCEDHHSLFPVEMDDDPNWDDGLWAIDRATTHAVFQRVGKARAGRLLDGVEHNGMPEARHG